MNDRWVSPEIFLHPRMRGVPATRPGSTQTELSWSDTKFDIQSFCLVELNFLSGKFSPTVKCCGTPSMGQTLRARMRK